jgi:hypothetical protein
VYNFLINYKVRIRTFCTLFFENHIQRVSKSVTHSTLVFIGVKKGLMSHGEAHVRLKRVLQVQFRVAQNEVLI